MGVVLLDTVPDREAAYLKAFTYTEALRNHNLAESYTIGVRRGPLGWSVFLMFLTGWQAPGDVRRLLRPVVKRSRRRIRSGGR